VAYTQVSAEDAAELLDAAGKAGLVGISPLAGGWANSNFLLQLADGSRVVLKVWNERTPEQVEELIAHTCWIAEHGFPTPVPLQLSGGERMLVKDGLACMLLPFVDASWLASDPDSLHALGEVQARLHAVPVCDGLSTSFSMGFELWEALFERAEAEGAWSPFLRMLEQEAVRLKEDIPDDLPSGIIHGDLFPDNVLGTTGNVLVVLDFEEVCVGALALDLMMAFVGFGWQDGEPVTERWQALLSGYESVRPLTDIERAALADLHRYATLSISAWRYWQFVMNRPESEHADRYLEMTARLDKPLPF
jgi:homoserine kinase type II